MATLCDAQIKAIIYNAVGRASETTTIPFTKLVISTGNSGYSIGALQTDFGQKPSAGKDLIDRYQQWAPADQMLSDTEVQVAKSIIVKRGLGDHPEIRLDSSVQSKLDNFLASAEGAVWVAVQDNAIYQRKLINIIQPILASPIYSDLGDNVGSEMIGRIAKEALNNSVCVGTRRIF